MSAQGGVESVAQGIGKVVENGYEDENRKSGEGHFPPHALPEAKAGVVYHEAPARFVLHADAEEGYEDFRRDGGGEADRELDEDDVRDVGEDVAEDDAGVGIAKNFGGEDVGAFAVFHDFRADGAAYADPCGKTDAEVYAGEALTDDEGDCKDEKQPGHGGYGGAQPHDERVDPSAEVAAEEA